MNLSSIIQQTENAVSCEIEDQTVLLNIEAGKYHGFNEVASRIWQIIEAPMKISQICDQLMQEFDISEAQCKSEVLGFLKQLNDAGLITIND
ncbi:lasso peptide biosynthesis PqqD family chaperone [Alteromonas sp. a30]|uniref:lasso peptide biosynthesis PqqD family chaperone n=1 Tax=Alteromonas sp. a30 TaxID=2730917 RepID=UPI00227E216F|nr:lasso peptide biosynthesis PqqD family chaperone [Alteromonas sp. a30]MCY7296708.1 lasso peptide biosynthesis PqqD family chaperone [Alteromonas sp. a30]